MIMMRDELRLTKVLTNEEVKAFRELWEKATREPDKHYCNECAHGSGACQEHATWDDQFDEVKE
jgi:hypothetical protein